MRTDFTDYLCRAHSVGKIMGGVPKPLTKTQKETLENWYPRLKGEGKPLTDNQIKTLAGIMEKRDAKVALSDGAKKYLKELHSDEVWGRTKEIESKYLDKGIIAEEQGISLYTEYSGRLYVKNKTRKENEYFSGECDINNSSEYIDDIKCSWDFDTFPAVEDKVTNTDYIWQGNAYCDLYGKERFRIVYCLVDTPFELIESELVRLHYKHNLFDGNGSIMEDRIPFVVEKLKKHLFSEKSLKEFCQQSPNVQFEWFEDNFIPMPVWARVKIFEFEKDEKKLDQAREMVVLARQYMNNLSAEMADKIK